MISDGVVTGDRVFGEGFIWERVLKTRFARLQLLFKLPLTNLLTNLHSKSQMPSIMKGVSLDKTNNIRIGRF
jgi:hypothetical protein